MRNPEHNRAHARVHDAVKRGILIKPETCEACGQIPEPAKDGRSRLHGHHHEGYDKPLSVQWLCVVCHNRETPLNPARGERSKMSKLTTEAVLAIRASDEHRRVLAARYGVTRWAIDRIRRRADWKWLP